MFKKALQETKLFEIKKFKKRLEKRIDIRKYKQNRIKGDHLVSASLKQTGLVQFLISLDSKTNRDFDFIMLEKGDPTLKVASRKKYVRKPLPETQVQVYADETEEEEEINKNNNV